MTTTPRNFNDEPDVPSPPRDELDSLLRDWHDANAAQARAGRDRLLTALEGGAGLRPASAGGAGLRPASSPVIFTIRRLLVNRYSPAAAALFLLALLVSILLPQTTPRSLAQPIVMAPDGGRLDALDPEGNILGPCELRHTDVNAEISGFFSRVTLRQKYHNPHSAKIEAVYTFPLSDRAAVDRMTMTVGDRVIVGEVKERRQARQIYDAARAEGRIASLLEQERPNIFTQSVANIEPGADIDIEISYVEVLEPRDGTFSFEFPTVVGPRYIPGSPTQSLAPQPADAHAPAPQFIPRRGVILLAPATIRITATGDTTVRAALSPNQLSAALASAIPIATPERPPHAQPPLWYEFRADYPDGSAEIGRLFTDHTGAIGGRWFHSPSQREGPGVGSPGSAFAPNTTQVPDASRITPMPVKPPTRAGHDISISVAIDTGGPAITDLAATLHEIDRHDGPPAPGERASRTLITLRNRSEIPNRDFILSWKTPAATIQESVLTHTGKNGNFLSLILQPPARIDPDLIVPRELIFVLDTSGSMSGFPIEKSKALATKSIDAMRPTDTFNIITFSGDTHILWNQPRPNTPENRAEAVQFFASRSGSGGTEMMTAINAALTRQRITGEPDFDARLASAMTIDQLKNLPADGRAVTVLLDCHPASPIGRFPDGKTQPISDWYFAFVAAARMKAGPFIADGRWATENGDRILIVDRTYVLEHNPRAADPLRLVFFLTDAYVGNDLAIIDAIKQHRGTTRVFPFGIGNSVNRFLIDGMARAGGGEPECVTLESDADAAVERLTRRISTPVLANIHLEFTGDCKVIDVLPAPNNIPDLFDQKPLIIQSRYTQAGKGALIITGTTGAGPYRREIPLDLPAAEPRHDTIATLWARSKVDSLMNEDLKAVQANTYPDELRHEVIRLGESFGIMTQYTSFVAVDRLRVTIGGKPQLVHIPIELPQGVSWSGNFGGGEADKPRTSERVTDFLIFNGSLRANSVDLYDSPQIDLRGVLQPNAGPGGDQHLFAFALDVDGAFKNINAVRGDSAVGFDPALKTVDELRKNVEHQPSADTTVSRGLERPITVPAKPAPPPTPTPPPAPAASAPPEVVQEHLNSRVPATDTPRRPRVFRSNSAYPARPSTPAAPADTTRAGGEAGRFTFTPGDRPSDPAGGNSGDDVDPGFQTRRTRLSYRAYGETAEGAEPRLDLAGGMVADGEAFGLHWRDLNDFHQAADTNQPPPRIVPAEWLTVRIAALVAKGSIDEARALATQLATAAPNYEPGKELQQLLAPPTDAEANKQPATPVDASPVLKNPVPPPDTTARDQRIAEIGAKAKSRLDDLIRRATLARRLDPRFLRFIDATGLPTTLVQVYDGPVPEGTQWLDGGILVSVLLADTEPPTLAALKSAGLRIDHTSAPTKVVIGILPLGRLADLALTDKVRRVEPTE